MINFPYVFPRIAFVLQRITVRSQLEKDVVLINIPNGNIKCLDSRICINSLRVCILFWKFTFEQKVIIALFILERALFTWIWYTYSALSGGSIASHLLLSSASCQFKLHIGLHNRYQELWIRCGSEGWRLLLPLRFENCFLLLAHFGWLFVKY